MEVAASKGRRGSTNDCLASKGPPGQGPAGGCENGVDGPEAGNGGGEEEVVTPGTSVFDGQVVALRNPVVLTRLFQVCSLRDLAKFRLVSKEWRDLSLKTWRASSPLKLERNAAELFLKGGTPLDEFLEYVEDPGNECGVKPFRRIKLEGWIFDPINAQIQRFWNLLGSNLTTLKFRDCKFPTVAEFRRIIYTACPNLHVLSFDRNCEFDEVDGSVSEIPTHYKPPTFGEHLELKCLSVKCRLLPVSWLEFLSHFPSLTSFKHHRKTVARSQWDDGLERLLNAIRVVRGHDAQKLPLEQFHIDHPPCGILPEIFTASQDRIFGLTRQLNLPLKYMYICLHPELDQEFANDILQFHSGTLEHLTTLRVTGQVEPNPKFNCRVQLDKVERLEVHHALFQSTGILKCVPNLKSLIIEEDSAMEGTRATFQEWMEELDLNEAVKLPTVTHLKYVVDNEFGFDHLEDLETLAKMLPNVERLVMPLDDDEFAIVCQHWKGLIELQVRSIGPKYYLNDKGLTGGVLHMTKPDLLWKHETVRPNIKDLKELRVFSCNSNRLTDISVYHGFLQLPQLKSVTLDMDGGHRPSVFGFGDEAQQDLREKGVEVKIIIR